VQANGRSFRLSVGAVRASFPRVQLFGGPQSSGGNTCSLKDESEELPPSVQTRERK